MSILNAENAGFSDEDFDVYRPECWSSNRYNLPRMRTKERVVQLTKSLADLFEDIDFKFDASSEIPSVWNGRTVKDQWGYWLRDENAQRTLQPILTQRLDLATRIKAPADHFKHLLFCIRLSHESLAIGLRLSRYATIDLENFLSHADTELEGLDAAIESIADEVKLDGESVDRMSLLAAAGDLKVGDREWIDLVHILGRESVIDGDLDMTEILAKTARSLLPLLRYILWSPENDHIDVSEEISSFAKQTEARTEAARNAAENKQQAHAKRAEKARDRTSAKMDAEEAWRQMQAKRRVTQAVSNTEKNTVAPKASKPPTRRDADPQKQQRRKSTRPAAVTSKKSAPRHGSKSTKNAKRSGPAPEFKPGQSCILSRGLFAGKRGEIVSADKPGYYMVKVGLLEVSVSGYDLQVDG
ncbi:MAG: hypothetical protein CMH52_00905 [Myxococcales bacterium]|nr:hypothetical protein [Myxococcales bacterium]